MASLSLPPTLAVVWTCRVYPFPHPAVCIDVQGVSPSTAISLEDGCKPFQSQQNGRAGCTLSTNISMDVQGVSFSTASSMDVQGVVLSTANRRDVQGVSLSTNISMDVQGGSLSTANRIDVQGVTTNYFHSQEYGGHTVCRPGCMSFYCQQYGPFLYA